MSAFDYYKYNGTPLSSIVNTGGTTPITGFTYQNTNLKGISTLGWLQSSYSGTKTPASTTRTLKYKSNNVDIYGYLPAISEKYTGSTSIIPSTSRSWANYISIVITGGGAGGRSGGINTTTSSNRRYNGPGGQGGGGGGWNFYRCLPIVSAATLQLQIGGGGAGGGGGGGGYNPGQAGGTTTVIYNGQTIITARGGSPVDSTLTKQTTIISGNIPNITLLNVPPNQNVRLVNKAGQNVDIAPGTGGTLYNNGYTDLNNFFQTYGVGGAGGKGANTGGQGRQNGVAGTAGVAYVWYFA